MSQVRRQSAMLPRPNWGWQDAAACRGEDLLLFFGPDGERQPEREIRERKAKGVCAACPVRLECLNYAVSRPEKYGTWGGLNEDERSAERRRRMRRANAAYRASVGVQASSASTSASVSWPKDVYHCPTDRNLRGVAKMITWSASARISAAAAGAATGAASTR